MTRFPANVSGDWYALATHLFALLSLELVVRSDAVSNVLNAK